MKIAKASFHADVTKKKEKKIKNCKDVERKQEFRKIQHCNGKTVDWQSTHQRIEMDWGRALSKNHIVYHPGFSKQWCCQVGKSRATTILVWFS